MKQSRSFKEYIKKRFDNNLWAVAEKYKAQYFNAEAETYYKLRKPGDVDIEDVNVEYVWIEDLLGMEIQFDIALSIILNVREGDYHYDENEEKIKWVLVFCKGSLNQYLNDFQIVSFNPYDGKREHTNALDDSLVPYIYKDELEKVATDFFREVFPMTLQMPQRGESPIWVDPRAVADNLGLKIISKQIKQDSSIFGQIYFEDTESEIYDKELEKDTLQQIAGRTIVVDPNVYLLRNIRCFNNTVIHECVHWYKHRKAFFLDADVVYSYFETYINDEEINVEGWYDVTKEF